MEQEKSTQTKKVDQIIKLVDGEFTPSEASHILMSLIDEKINFHKIQRLQIWEGNHKCETNDLDNRINKLLKEKEIAKQFINNTRELGENLKINGTLEITITK
jgi:hypothetical protein